jgi:hypothetical protein
MSGQIPRPIGSIGLVATLLVWSVSFGAAIITVRADDCLAEPNSPAPAGSHWYYHMDRAKQHKCWYIRATDQPAQPAAAQATSDSTSLPPAPPIPLEKPATAPASGPISISPDDSTPPLPRVKVVKPPRPPVSSATTDQALQQSAQKGPPQASSASSKPGAPSQTGNPGTVANVSAGTPVWPDPPLVAFKTPEPTAPSSDTQRESTRPTTDASVSDDAKSTAQGGASANNAVGTSTSGSMMPVAMFPIAALGLVVAGFLLRIVMKISARRRRRIVIDHPDSDLIDDRQKHEPRDDQSPHPRDRRTDDLQRLTTPTATDPRSSRSSRIDDERLDNARGRDPISPVQNKITRERSRIGVDSGESEWIDDRRQREGRNDQREPVAARDELIDDLQSSLIQAASDYQPRPPLDAADEWTNSERGKDGATQISDEIKEREEALERLRRDLDRLLQSRQVA